MSGLCGKRLDADGTAFCKRPWDHQDKCSSYRVQGDPVKLGLRCQERESGGVQCELPLGHDGKHACPDAMAQWPQKYPKRRRRFVAGDKVCIVTSEARPDLVGKTGEVARDETTYVEVIDDEDGSPTPFNWQDLVLTSKGFAEDPNPGVTPQEICPYMSGQGGIWQERCTLPRYPEHVGRHVTEPIPRPAPETHAQAVQRVMVSRPLGEIAQRQPRRFENLAEAYAASKECANCAKLRAEIAKLRTTIKAVTDAILEGDE